VLTELESLTPSLEDEMVNGFWQRAAFTRQSMVVKFMLLTSFVKLLTRENQMTYFAKTAEAANETSMFVGTKKFEQGGYARCRNRIYKVLRISVAGVPVLRLYGTVRARQSYPTTYEFKHASLPKGRYAKDIEGELTMKNYTPCKRGDWWKGAVAYRPTK
jgi:hypothetical protein